MKASERQSIFKTRNSVVNAKANNVCLAVFPYQIEFTSKQEFTSVFYFEKDLQIIGSFTTKIQKNQQRTSLALRDIENLITFRIYKFHNLNYKWSQYRILESGEEEFIESASINLKASLGQLVPLSGSGSFRSHESYIIPSNIEKQLRVKLQKTGVVINFLLLICDDQKQLEAAVRDKFFKAPQSKKQEKVQQPKDNQMLSQQTQKDIKAIDQGPRQEVAQQINSAEKHLSFSGNDKDATKEGYLLQLDALILDHNHHDQTLNDKAEHAHTVQNEEDDLCFGIQKSKVSQKVTKQESEAVSNPNPQNEEKKTIIRDFSLLRLESDQGITLDPLDRRLESQQLQVIEEQPGFSPSIIRAEGAEETANQESSKQTTYLALKTESISSKVQQHVTFTRQNKTKLSIIVLIVVVTLLAVFAFPRQLKLRTKGRARRVGK